MLPRICTFLDDSSGAITVDFTVLTAGVVGLGLASVGAVSTGQNALAVSIRDALANAFVSGNDLLNSNFDDFTGLIRTGWGWLARDAYGGWQALTADTAFELIASGYGGVQTPDGTGMLDMGASPGNLSMGRVIDGLSAGSEHRVMLNAADIIGNNQVDIYFGGDLVGSIDAGRSMSEYEFSVIAGAGDGTDMLILSESGQRDNVGTYVNGIRFY